MHNAHALHAYDSFLSVHVNALQMCEITILYRSHNANTLRFWNIDKLKI